LLAGKLIYFRAFQYKNCTSSSRTARRIFSWRRLGNNGRFVTSRPDEKAETRVSGQFSVTDELDYFRMADHTPQEEVCGWGGVLLVFGDVHHKLRLTTASAVCSEYQFRFITFIAEEWP